MKHLINKFYCLSTLILLMPAKVFAADENSSPMLETTINTGQMSGGYMLQLVLGLIIVLACIVVLAWLAKRMNRLQSSTGDMLKIIGGINVGTREKIVLLQVGSEQLLIGIAQGNINKLHLLTTPIETGNDNHRKTFALNLSEKMGLSEKSGAMQVDKK